MKTYHFSLRIKNSRAMGRVVDFKAIDSNVDILTIPVLN